MQKVLTLTATCLLGILLCASAALADEVKTDHFTLNLPSGWTQPQPVQSAQGATMAILQNAAEQTVITVAVTPVPLSAKDLAIQTIANMKAAGFTTSEPVASGDSYVGEFSKEQVRGVSYFSANGKLGSVITIMGASLDAGKKMLAVISIVVLLTVFFHERVQALFLILDLFPAAFAAGLAAALYPRLEPGAAIVAHGRCPYLLTMMAGRICSSAGWSK